MTTKTIDKDNLKVQLANLRVEGANFFIIRFWGSTYDPGKLLHLGMDLFMDVAEIIQGNVEVSRDGENWRLATMTNLEVFETLQSKKYQHIFTTLAANRPGRSAWAGQYQMGFLVK